CSSDLPDFVFVALGCPKQEKWMAEHRGKINACMLGLGQAFHVYAGKERRLPRWMRSLSLEWAYRLYLEPRRLWKRYLVTNSLFLLLAFQRLGGKLVNSLKSSEGKPPSAWRYRMEGLNSSSVLARPASWGTPNGFFQTCQGVSPRSYMSSSDCFSLKVSIPMN